MASLLWEVVGGNSSGGIQVRGGRSLSSTAFDCRLSTGSLLLQRSLLGQRLRYSLVAGGGPTEGWVSLSSHGRALVQNVEVKQTDERVVIACVGDSITGGGSVRQSGTYPALLQRLLRHEPAPDGLGGWSVGNFGVGGTTATREAPHTPYIRTLTFREAALSGADIFVLCFGTNDTHRERWSEDGFVRGLCRLVEVLQASGPCIVLLMTPPPVYMWSGFASIRESSVINHELPKRILPGIAQGLGLQLLDLFDPLGGEQLTKGRFMVDDGIHPDISGNEVIAGIVHRALLDVASTGQVGRNRFARRGPLLPASLSDATDGCSEVAEEDASRAENALFMGSGLKK